MAVKSQNPKIYLYAYDLLLSCIHRISHILVEPGGGGFSEGSSEVCLDFHAILVLSVKCCCTSKK